MSLEFNLEVPGSAAVGSSMPWSVYAGGMVRAA